MVVIGARPSATTVGPMKPHATIAPIIIDAATRMPTSPPTPIMSRLGSSLKPSELAEYPLSGNDNATDFSEYNTYKYVETAEDLQDFSRTSHELVVSELKRYLADLQDEDRDAGGGRATGQTHISCEMGLP